MSALREHVLLEADAERGFGLTGIDFHRRRAIEAEREALDRDIDEAARRLGSLQEQLASLSDELEAAGQARSDERKKLDEAQEKAKAAQDRLGALRRDETQSLEAKRQDVGERQSLIAGVALMVDALSN